MCSLKRCQADGNLGINVDDPTESLHIDGNMIIDGNITVVNTNYIETNHIKALNSNGTLEEFK